MSPNRSGTTSTERQAHRRERMVERQLRRRGIDDERVLHAMGDVPRECFVPAELRGDAYRDGALPIGAGQTVSQPWIVACMTMLAEPGPAARVLEVGTGSGYGAAVLSRCCADVVSVERHEDLAARARIVIERLGYENVELRAGDGSRGAPDRAPFDAIVVTAAVDAAQPPAALRDQLRPGAPLVCPVKREQGQYLMRFRDDHEESVVPVRFVPLVTSAEASGR